MKNASPQELQALQARAREVRSLLPPLERAADGRLTPHSLAAVGSAAGRILRRERAVGASLVLCHPGGAEDILCFGHARLSPRTPVTPRTCMRIASVTKLVMSMVVMHLAENGRLELDADISQTLAFPVRSPHHPGVPVTLRMLLTHTSGICDEGSYGTRGMQPGCTLAELLADAQNWTDRRPGEAFHYSNLGAGVAGVLCECAADAPFDALLQSAVGIPLDIRVSCRPGAVDPPSDLADGYSVRGILPPRRRYDAAALARATAQPPAPDPMRDYLITAGRIITDSRGMARLIRLLASDGEVGGVRVLKPESLDEIRTLQDGRGGILRCGRGLNAAFLPEVFPGFSPVGHQGVAYGMCAELFADPKRRCGVGVMTSGVRLVKTPPLMRAGFDLLALSFAAIDAG